MLETWTGINVSRYGSQIETGGANGSVQNAGTKNHLQGNGGLEAASTEITRSSFNGNSGMSSLGSIGDNLGGACARARNSHRSEGGGSGLEAMRGVHVGGFSSGSNSFEADSEDSAWLSMPAKAEERFGMGAFDFMSRGLAGYINRQPNGGIAA
ncbi:RNA-binding (RRM/RBD/RNP motifs) family protein [Raphanus sativus]|uniref:Uncharacterized protein LOC108832804 n=1 Tax=Raphanus sativus TaxID=3726 RepID=A0A6J0LNC1_RAPSA|nr:uncharacterized protein LOC108832804 [Raphanus sativus]KAJ4901388.1 RNA-binding (RRM/RBD/RNP motifs) family protein [Raphanus sativus]